MFIEKGGLSFSHMHATYTNTKLGSTQWPTANNVEAFSHYRYDGIDGCLRSRLMFAGQNAGVSFVSHTIFLSAFPVERFMCFSAGMEVPRPRSWPSHPNIPNISIVLDGVLILFAFIEIEYF